MIIYVLMQDGRPVNFVRDYKLEMAKTWASEQPGREVVPVEEAS